MYSIKSQVEQNLTDYRNHLYLEDRTGERSKWTFDSALKVHTTC